jgi:hypothetical protein
MRNFGDPIDIGQFTADLMELTSGDIELIQQELKEHYMFAPIGGDEADKVSPEVLTAWAIIGAAKEEDKTKAVINLNIAKWFKKYSELEHQHEEDEMWMSCTREEIKFWEEFWNYITDKAIGDRLKIIDAVANNERNWFEGYVKVEKSINEKQELLIKFTNSKGDKYTAEWQPSDNYACWQTCGMAGDDYSGYLLFPTYKADEYFCIYYNC